MSSIKYQYYATICANLATISYGIALGWASPTIPLLLSIDTPLASGPLTNTEASWIVSIFCIGGGIGAIFFGWAADRIGRRISIFVCGFSQLISWLLIPFGTNTYYLYGARYLMGFTAGGIFLLIPLFVSEISEDRIRGTLGSYLILSCNVGILIGYIIGGYINYYIVPIIALTFTLLLIIGFIFLPETPLYLLNQNRIEEAKKSLCYYRDYLSSNEKSGNLIIELKNLKDLSSKENISECDQTNTITFKDFLIPSTVKGILIGTVLMSMTQFCGTFAILNYTAFIFQASGSKLTPNVCAIIIGCIQLIGSYCSCILVDRLGRKILLIISSFGTGIGLTSMGIYFYLQHNNYDLSAINWLPLLSLSETVFIASLGIIPLAFVVTTEVLPQKLRSVVPSFFFIILWIIAFIFIRYFNDIIKLLNMHVCMWFFAACCFFETIFIIFIIPETKGKSSNAIIKLLESTTK